MQQMYDQITRRYPGLHFSQSDDGTICRFFQLAAVEVKSPDGSYYGSSVQLAIWLAAGLEKMRLLQAQAAATSHFSNATSAPSGGGDEEVAAHPLLMPYPGIAVVGQAWYLHLATKADNGAVVCTKLNTRNNSIN